jgi:hypothetical protein
MNTSTQRSKVFALRPLAIVAAAVASTAFTFAPLAAQADETCNSP